MMSNENYRYILKDPDGNTAEYNTFKDYEIGDKIDLCLSRSGGAKETVSYEIVEKAGLKPNTDAV